MSSFRIVTVYRCVLINGYGNFRWGSPIRYIPFRIKTCLFVCGVTSGNEGKIDDMRLIPSKTSEVFWSGVSQKKIFRIIEDADCVWNDSASVEYTDLYFLESGRVIRIALKRRHSTRPWMSTSLSTGRFFLWNSVFPRRSSRWFWVEVYEFEDVSFLE